MRLVIDTASAACSVALLDGERLVAERHEVVGRGHAERLVPQIAELLRDHGGRSTDIVVDCGPGSFTGVRVGLAAARALALGWNVPVHGYSATAVVAAGAFALFGDREHLCVAISGGHGELFLRRFARLPALSGDELVSLPPERAAFVIPDELVVGSGAAALIAARGFGMAEAWLPRAADARLLDAGWVDLAPVPIYGRAPDAKLPVA